MDIKVKNKQDKEIVKEVLWDIGFDVFHKINFIIDKDINYHSVYNYILNIIVELKKEHLFFQKLIIATPLAPSNNHYLQQARWGGKYTPAKTKQFQNMFKDEISKHKDNWIVVSENKYLDTVFTFWFERDDRDANNYFKVTLDVCEDILYHNDKRTIPITKDVFINGSQDSFQIMELTPSDKIGVFSNLNDLQSFISNNCLQCNRGGYNRRCRVFYDILENRTNDFCIKNNKCLQKD